MHIAADSRITSAYAPLYSFEYAPMGSIPVGVSAMGNEVTRSPTLAGAPSVIGPISSISPVNSWPMMKSRAGSNAIGTPISRVIATSSSA